MKLPRAFLFMWLSLLWLASNGLTAETPSFMTNDVFNGRMWHLLSSSQRAAHLNGIQEGIKLCLNQIREDMHTSVELMQAMKECRFTNKNASVKNR